MGRFDSSRSRVASVFDRLRAIDRTGRSWLPTLLSLSAREPRVTVVPSSGPLTYAKTMPDWPHEYLIRGRVDKELFERTVKHLRSNGFQGRFYTKTITYYEKGALVYWTMGAALHETTIINRCRKEDSFDYRSRHGTLPR